MPSTLRYRCGVCSSEFRPVFHLEGETCPKSGRPRGWPGGSGAGEQEAEQQPAEAREQGEGDGQGEGDEQDEGEAAGGTAEQIQRETNRQTPPPPESQSSIEDLIVKIARREAGTLDTALIKAVAGEFDTRSASTEQALEALRKAYSEGEGSTITIEVQKPGEAPQRVEGQHRMFSTLLRLANARANAYLVGPAGSGKTVSVQKVAETLGLRFYPKSMGPTTTAYELLGYMDAGGNYVPGLLYEPFTQGGLLLLDEIDSASAAAVTTLNTALANDYCAFPHGVFKKHQDCTMFASGNTYGRGADRMYVGRTQLDAATLNRFFVVDWDYDETFEKGLAKAYAESLACPSVMDWMNYVHRVRRAISKNGIRAVAGTRDIVEGAKALAAGFTIEQIADMRFYAAMSADEKGKIKEAVKV